MEPMEHYTALVKMLTLLMSAVTATGRLSPHSRLVGRVASRSASRAAEQASRARAGAGPWAWRVTRAERSSCCTNTGTSSPYTDLELALVSTSQH